MLRMTLHQEHHFEAEICQHLATHTHGWFHEAGDAALFDRGNGRFPPDLLAWIEATQPESFQRLTMTHGASLPAVLAERVRKSEIGIFRTERGCTRVGRSTITLAPL
jgi:type I restriction enzyme R subunit